MGGQCPGNGAFYRVCACTSGFNSGVAPAHHIGVVTRPAGEHIGCAVAAEYVVQGIAGGVDGGGAGQRDVLYVGTQGVVHAGLHQVSTSIQVFGNYIAHVVHHIGVVAQATNHGVRTGAPVEHVVTRVASQHVVCRVASAVDGGGTGKGEVLHIGGQCPGNGALHRVSACASGFNSGVARAHNIGVVTGTAGEGVGCAVACQDIVQRVARAVDGCRTGERQVLNLISQGPGDRTLHGINSSAGDFYGRVTRANHVSVIARTAGHHIVTGTAIQDVVASTAVQGVITGQAAQRIVASATVQGIGTRCAVQSQILHTDRHIKDVRGAQVATVPGGHFHAHRTECCRRTAEGAGSGIEHQPTRQRTAVCKCGAVGERITSVRIGEGSGGNGVAEDAALRGRLVGECRGQYRRAVGCGNRHVDVFASRVVVVVGPPQNKLQSAHISGAGCSSYRAGSRIECQPGGDRRSVRHLDAVGNGIPNIRVGDGVGWHHIVKGAVGFRLQGWQIAVDRGRMVVVGAVHHGLDHCLVPHHTVGKFHPV